MNLTELARYNDPSLVVGGEHFVAARHSLEGVRWVGFDVHPAASAQMRLKNVLSLRPFAAFPESLGWSVAWPDTLPVGDAPRTVRVRLEDAGTGQTLAETRVSVKPGGVAPISFDWPARDFWSDRVVELTVHLDKGAGGPVFLAVSRLLRRPDFIAPIRGTGVEIGPGMSPQILPGPDTNVLYVDEATREEWEATYAYKREKWQDTAVAVDFSLYRSGGALNLPVEDASLDFIFGSHVFEHLINPAQHLANWIAKLKPGGRIHMIIPYAQASLDYRQATSTLADILSEYDSGATTLQLSHYQRIFGAKAERALAEKRSLHVHFFTPDLLADLFAWAQIKIGVKRYRIHHHDNYRELFFTLEKA